MPNSETPPKATPGERPCKNAKGTHHGRTYHICVYFYNCLLIPNDLLDNLLHLMILVFATPRWINDLSSHAVLNNLSSHHTLDKVYGNLEDGIWKTMCLFQENV
ncbi:uncharacterized protein LOC129633627 isoform X7 [Bubalus kerabau]|uniref:uncharacterized protein LOC129633627 isoform X7 n=1 Tax=Bubalus carabanensis TaxID=3119969 RepID=UPI00244EFFFD|nr:uncharacterized protein LOC129633627 isoform X7 [Bubalus carabanensis]XP_055411427.1 uncharacterized protein LOC129633627 isoform X7 [Bubalus carabanensis]XP_055411428.1 uncharacterized protein LOC129633627 isoform X7 [Bubalus carabanensis]XP_055411429.1 uncharacterized protein LOC129633627 isoform X7 [Bubalus carabanensis]